MVVATTDPPGTPLPISTQIQKEYGLNGGGVPGVGVQGVPRN